MIGIGKLTVAKLLAEKLDARLIDNHLLIDLVVAMCGRSGDEYFILIEKLMDVVLEHIAKKPDEVFIFTNALSAKLEEDRERLDKIRSFADEKNIKFIQILLECELEENKRRMVSEDRKLKGKLIDTNKLDKIYENHAIYHPTSEFTLKIDTTSLSAESVSNTIKSYIEDIQSV